MGAIAINGCKVPSLAVIAGVAQTFVRQIGINDVEPLILSGGRGADRDIPGNVVRGATTYGGVSIDDTLYLSFAIPYRDP